MKVFSLLWLIVFVLYLPAAKAGFVTDFTGWLDQVKNHSFSEYINRDNFKVKSLYQSTQFVTYIFYLLIGANAWLWHLLFVSLQAVNALLLWRFFSRLFLDTGVENGTFIALGGAVLFCICPHISEVIVWEPSFHYLQGLLIIMTILLCLQAFFKVQRKRYIWISLIIYAFSLFSLEYFYLTPLLASTLILYYRYVLSYDRAIIKKANVYFILPLFLLFICRMLLFRFMYHDWVSRIGSETLAQSLHEYLVKPPVYLFHIVFMGRFFSHDFRQKIYALCESTTLLVIFYSQLGIICAYLLFCFKKLSSKCKAAVFVFFYTLLALCLILPLWLPKLQLVLMDRYTYMLCAFLYMLIALLISIIPGKYLRISVFAVFAMVNLRFAIQVSRYWMKSAHVNNNLLHTYPPADDKITILLDQPENMHGVPMIQATNGGEFKLMYNLLQPGKIKGIVLDAASFNMETPMDGAHVKVVSDSMIQVTLNQWGTWWWYDGFGATDRENEYYKIHFYDGHWYDLLLKKPASEYRLLFQSGSEWKTVDWNRKNEDQY